ncbi:MAG: hypothetical protein FJY67_05780 [Calditrichaeota bacterium]|nr:hypothetical protein [Calditrichota bacterium]
MEPIQKLMAEHQVILTAIDRLERLAAQFDRDQKVASDDLLDCVEFVRNYADDYHHAKEEDVLFVWMEQHGFSRQMGPVAVMLHEHDQSRDLVRFMKAAGEKGEPLEAAETADVIRAMRTYAYLLRSHIQKEDQILYPMAQANIPPDGWRQMTAEFMVVEEAKFATGEPSRYERWAMGN